MMQINRDLFRIGERLKKINPAYRVFYNNRARRYEVHTVKSPDAVGVTPFTKGGFRGREKTNFEFIIPYETLDCRTLDYALKTRRQNAHQIEQEINANNESVKQSASRKMEQATIELEDMLAYSMRAGHTVNFTRNYLKEF